MSIRLICCFTTLIFPITSFSTIVDSNILLGQFYSDNIGLDQSHRTDVVTYVQPKIFTTLDNSQGTIEASYQASLLKALKNSTQDRTYHSALLSFLTKHDQYNLKIDSRYTQDLTDPASTHLSPSSYVGVKQPDILITSLSPSLNTEVSDLLNLSIDGLYSIVSYFGENPKINTANNYSLAVSLDTDDHLNKIKVKGKINAHYKYQGESIARNVRATIKAEKEIAKKSFLYAVIGSENIVENSNQSSNGVLSTVGLLFYPSKNTHFDFGIGHRAFGTTYDFNLAIKRKKMHLKASYNEEVSSTAVEKIDQLLSQRVNFFSEDTLLPYYTDTTDLLYVHKKYHLGLDYSFPKTKLSLNGFHASRHFIENTMNTYGQGLNFNLIFQPNLKHSLQFSYLVSEQKFINNDQANWYQFKLKIEKSLAQNILVFLKASHFKAKHSILSSVPENNISINIIYKNN